ncbi:MAG: nucleotidyl transferase AbiEii/AbiGii toxin family protein [Myxococcota bacterium]
MAEASLTADFIDLFVCLSDAGAQHLLVGGYAMNAYGVVRATEDLDVFVGRAPENLEKVIEALRMFGSPPAPSIHELRRARAVPAGFRFGRPPVRVGVLTAIAGVETLQAIWAGRTVIEVSGVQIPVIGIEALRANKKAAGRLKDLADVQALDALYGSSS